MKTMLSAISSLLLAYGTSLAQGVFEAPLSLSLGESASLCAGMGYFRVTGTTVDYELLVYDLTAGSLSPVIATASFESSFTTGVGQVVTVSGGDLFPPNPFLPWSGSPGTITFPAMMNWADYWGTITLPAEQVAELLSQGGLLRIPGTSGFPFGSGGEIQGAISLVPEPSSFVLLAGGLLWLIRFKGGRVAQARRSTEWRPREATGNAKAYQFIRIRESKMLKHVALIAAVFGLAMPIGAADNYPGATWEHVKSLSEAGWSAAKLKAARQYASTIPSDGVMIVEDGLVVSEWGAVSQKILIHSMRKSYLSALYGIYVNKGVIRLSTTLAELGIDDNPPSLTAEEKQATIEDLLKARSGVYHPALAETAFMENNRPERGSHPHGTFWYYNNWDFNALGTIFEKVTGKKIFEEMKLRLANPLQMEDYEVTDGKYSKGSASIHPAYLMRLTARDIARFGLLYMHQGAWRGKQILSRDWVERSVTSYSHAGSMGGYGYLWWVAVNGKLFPGVKLEDGSFAAEGVGGNYLVVIPSRKLVIVHRANTGAGHKVKRADFAQLLSLILAAKTTN